MKKTLLANLPGPAEPNANIKADPGEFEKNAVKVSNVSIIGNSLLAAFKLLAGIIGHSQAMVSDAIHSASDVLSSFIVIIGVKLSAKDSDREHPYGHERFEPVAAIVLAIVLCITGLFIGHTAVENLRSGGAEINTQPGLLAVIAAAISIAAKEAMYWYTRFYGKKFDSEALMASAWHHRSDALSSIGSLVGILGARMGYWWFDPVASLLICVFIVKAAYDIFLSAIKKMTDRACDTDTQRQLASCAENQQGVLGVHEMKTREFGNRIYVDLEVYASGEITLLESYDIGRKVHNAIEHSFTKVKHITVVVKPAPEGEKLKLFTIR